MAGQFQNFVHSVENFIHVHVIPYLIHIKTQKLFHVSFVKSGGMYIDICGLFGLSQSSFFHPVHGPLWPTIYALDVALANMVVFKTDIASCEKSAADFAHFSRGMLQHCVCAVDGNLTSFLVQLVVRLQIIYVPNINNLLLIPIYFFAGAEVLLSALGALRPMKCVHLQHPIWLHSRTGRDFME